VASVWTSSVCLLVMICHTRNNKTKAGICFRTHVCKTTCTWQSQQYTAYAQCPGAELEPWTDRGCTKMGGEFGSERIRPIQQYAR